MAETIRGLDVIIEVAQGDGELKKVGGQRGASLSREGEAMEATSKDTKGWRSYVPGFKDWSVEADGLVITDDEGYSLLEDAFNEDEPVVVTLAMPSGTVYKGDAIVTDFPIELPYDDLATYSLTLQGNGKLKKE